MSSTKGKPVTEKGKATNSPKVKKPKVPKEKKPKGSKASSPSHPPYFQMIKDAILALHERTGSSPRAIAKYIEEKHKGDLPANFRKILSLQLKNLAVRGKLLKIKASFKLSDSGKQAEKKALKDVKKPKALVKGTKQNAAAKSAPGKRKADTIVKAAKSAPGKRKAATTVKKPVPTSRSAKKTPLVKKVKKAAPAKPKQPKSIKSPAAKRAKKAAA